MKDLTCRNPPWPEPARGGRPQSLRGGIKCKLGSSGIAALLARGSGLVESGTGANMRLPGRQANIQVPVEPASAREAGRLNKSGVEPTSAREAGMTDQEGGSSLRLPVRQERLTEGTGRAYVCPGGRKGGPRGESVCVCSEGSSDQLTTDIYRSGLLLPTERQSLWNVWLRVISAEPSSWVLTVHGGCQQSWSGQESAFGRLSASPVSHSAYNHTVEPGVLSQVEYFRLTPCTLSSVAALARLELGIVSRLASTRDRVRTERQVPWAGPPDNYAALVGQLPAGARLEGVRPLARGCQLAGTHLVR